MLTKNSEASQTLKHSSFYSNPDVLKNMGGGREALSKYKFGKEKRPEAVSKHIKLVPGPGMYDKDADGKWEKIKS